MQDISKPEKQVLILHWTSVNFTLQSKASSSIFNYECVDSFLKSILQVHADQ